MNYFLFSLLLILFAHYVFLMHKEHYYEPPAPDCSKCKIDVIEDTKDPNYDGKGVIEPFGPTFKPRQNFNPDVTGNIIGRFERFTANQKQNDNELARFVQMNSLQRM